MVEKKIKDLPELADFAREFLEARSRGATVGLSGELGSGKTTFVRACVEVIALSTGRAVPRVTSPSFVLHQIYPELVPPVEHFDLYRLEDLDEEGLMNLGYPESHERCKRSQGFLFVEWPEKVRTSGLLGLDCRISITIAGAARRYRVDP